MSLNFDNYSNNFYGLMFSIFGIRLMIRFLYLSKNMRRLPRENHFVSDEFGCFSTIQCLRSQKESKDPAAKLSNAFQLA